MEDKEKQTAISDFTAKLYHKGYRGYYTVEHPGTGHPKTIGPLSKCLEKFISLHKLTGKSELLLQTKVPYNDDIQCRFTVNFEGIKGFRIEGMEITDAISRETKRYRISSNHQIPGANAIQGLFPRPKPWDHIKKGKFRP